MTSPFVLFKNKATSVDGNTETIIFSSKSTSIVDSLCIVNTYTKPILVKIMLNKADGGVISNFVFRQWFVVDASDYKEMLIDSNIIVEPTDTLTALSKKPVDIFNAIVSYRALTELV